MTTITITDPVCGMPVQDTPATPRITYRGRTYVFCSGICRHRFEVAPERYERTDDTSRA